MKRKMMSLVLAAAMVAGMASMTVMAEEDLLVYGIYKAGDQTWFIDEGEAAKNAVEALGGEFVYVDAKMNPEEYLKAIDNAVANTYGSEASHCLSFKEGSLFRIRKTVRADVIEAFGRCENPVAEYCSACFYRSKQMFILIISHFTAYRCLNIRHRTLRFI